MTARLLVVFVLACSSKQGTATSGSGTGVPPPSGDPCAAAKPAIEQLYRDEAVAKKESPERIAEAVADNTTMVMAECAQAPDRVAPCVRRVTTAAELEKQCLAPLDDEGTEGEALRK